MADFERKHKENKPVVAICYDFDKTLSPDDMQAQGFIQSVGCDVDSFWKESNGRATDNDMDQNLAYMYTMMKKARANVPFTKKNLQDYGSKVTLFPGADTWFERIREFGKEKGVIVEHYIISSGLKEMIEGTKVTKSFEKIYASAFYYDEDGVAIWPAQVVNYTNKTQFLFRIEKGVLDINDQGVNDYFAPEDIRVPFRNMIYIGDSDTDIPCMKLVNSYGGHSIGVYNPNTNKKEKVYKMMHDNRIRYFAAANYSEGSDLDNLVKAIIDRTYSNEILENIHYENKKEFEKNDENITKEQKERRSLILDLENSGTFKTTHMVVEKMRKITEWSDSEKNWLLDIANTNSQVWAILEDNDIESFFKYILKDMKNLSKNGQEVKSKIEKEIL